MLFPEPEGPATTSGRGRGRGTEDCSEEEVGGRRAISVEGENKITLSSEAFSDDVIRQSGQV